MYYCSPWGIWDSYLPRPTDPKDPNYPGPSLIAPTFYKAGGSTVPLNGVTFYLTPGSNYLIEGNPTNYLAYPNPCPVTGSV